MIFQLAFTYFADSTPQTQTSIVTHYFLTTIALWFCSFLEKFALYQKVTYCNVPRHIILTF
jgi:hypothetical protein